MNNLLIAALITTIAVLLGLLFRSNQAVRRHKELLTKTRLALTAVVASSEDKTAQWQATLAGMLDGLMVLDAELRLVEWNQNFPKFVGVPADIHRASWRP